MAIVGNPSGRNGWTSREGLNTKFYNHNREPGMNYLDPDHYHKGAWNVVKNPNTIVGDHVDGGGKTGHYNPKTNKLVVKNEDNQKITFYVPTRKMDYFLDHFNPRK